MSTRPAPDEDGAFLYLYRWIAPAIAVLLFVLFENMNADAAEEFRRTDLAWHALVMAFSAVGGALFAVPVTAIGNVLRIIFE